MNIRIIENSILSFNSQCFVRKSFIADINGNIDALPRIAGSIPTATWIIMVKCSLIIIYSYVFLTKNKKYGHNINIA